MNRNHTLARSPQPDHRAPAPARNNNLDGLIDTHLKTAIQALADPNNHLPEVAALSIVFWQIAEVSLLDEDPKLLVPTLTKLTDAIGRGKKNQRVLSINPDESIQIALDRAFRRLGLSEVVDV